MPPRHEPQVNEETSWAAIRTALDRLFVFPEDTAATQDPLTLTPVEWTSAYSTAYNWSTSATSAHLYPLLDEYLSEVCARLRGRLAGEPVDQLLATYNVLYRGFDKRLRVLGRLTAYLERHATSHARDTGKGWLRCPFPEAEAPPAPVFRVEGVMVSQEAVSTAKNSKDPNQRRSRWFKKISHHAHHNLTTEWELPRDAAQGSDAWNDALTRAEAGSDPEKVIFVGARALGLRRWRLAVLEPLLQDGMAQQPSLLSSDAAALTQFASSMKDVGIRAGDERRQQVALALENPLDSDGK
jgi:hypothetical protein